MPVPEWKISEIISKAFNYFNAAVILLFVAGQHVHLLLMSRNTRSNYTAIIVYNNYIYWRGGEKVL